MSELNESKQEQKKVVYIERIDYVRKRLILEVGGTETTKLKTLYGYIKYNILYLLYYYIIY